MMDKQKIEGTALPDKLLEKISGGITWEGSETEGDVIIFHLEPNESCKAAMTDDMKSHDRNGLLRDAMEVLDAPDRIGKARTLKVRIDYWSIIEVQY